MLSSFSFQVLLVTENKKEKKLALYIIAAACENRQLFVNTLCCSGKVKKKIN